MLVWRGEYLFLYTHMLSRDDQEPKFVNTVLLGTVGGTTSDQDLDADKGNFASFTKP